MSLTSQRVKGQEVEVLLVVDGVPKTTITAVRSFTGTAMLELLEEGYLGETSDRFDELFKGAEGKIELHMDSPDALDLLVQIINRAKRRTPGTQVNVKATLNFPSGLRRRVLMQDAFFSNAPLAFGGRQQYGELTFDWKCSDIRYI
jgi:hypothetical protein